MEMSEKSPFRRRQTAPIVSRRSRSGALAAVALIERPPISPAAYVPREGRSRYELPARTVWCSSGDESQPVLADLDLVAVLERRGLDAAPVDERAVEAPLVLDRHPFGLADERR